MIKNYNLQKLQACLGKYKKKDIINKNKQNSFTVNRRIILQLSIKSNTSFYNKVLIEKIFKTWKFISIKKKHTTVRKNLYTVLRSPHVDKKAREQFYKKTHTVVLKLFFENIWSAYMICNYIQEWQQGVLIYAKIITVNNFHN